MFIIFSWRYVFWYIVNCVLLNCVYLCNVVCCYFFKNNLSIFKLFCTFALRKNDVRQPRFISDFKTMIYVKF